jgi:hypothetical protein
LQCVLIIKNADANADADADANARTKGDDIFLRLRLTTVPDDIKDEAEDVNWCCLSLS